MKQKILFRTGRNLLCSWLYSRVGTQGKSRFNLFISNVNQGNKEAGWIQNFLA